MEKGTFTGLGDTEIPPCSRIFGMSIVDKQKDDGSLESWLCVQAFTDKKHGLFVAAPTMQRSSITLFFPFALGRSLRFIGEIFRKRFCKVTLFYNEILTRDHLNNSPFQLVALWRCCFICMVCQRAQCTGTRTIKFIKPSNCAWPLQHQIHAFYVKRMMTVCPESL
jgi:hypothetical protein